MEELTQDLNSSCTQCGRPQTCSCCWDREQFLPTGGTLGQGWSSFAKKGTWVPWQKAEGCPDLCVHFQKHLILDQILSAVLKLGQWMGNAYWPGWLEAPTEGAGAQPGVPSAGKLSFQSWSEGVCHNSNSQGSPEAAYPSILKFLLAGIFGSNGEWVVMMQNLWPGSKNESSAGVKVFNYNYTDRPITKRVPEDTISFNPGLTYNLSIPAAVMVGSSDPCLLIKQTQALGKGRKSSHCSPSWTFSCLGQVY